MVGLSLPAFIELFPASSPSHFDTGTRHSHKASASPSILATSDLPSPFRNSHQSVHTRSTRFQKGNLGSLHVSATSKADDSLPSEISLENAMKILGVAEGASFDEILRAKNSKLKKHSGNQELVVQVEAAYDVLLMRSLLQRRAGKLVDNSVRYADVKKSMDFSTGQLWNRDILSKSPVSLEMPQLSVIGLQSAVYAGLMVLTFSSGVSLKPSWNINANVDAPGLILAIGFGASLYFLRKQDVKLGKAAVLTIASLVGGAMIGGTVESWLQVDLVPVFGISSPTVFVSEFVLISLWLSSMYLR